MILSCARVKPQKRVRPAIWVCEKTGREVCDLTRKLGRFTYINRTVDMATRQGCRCAMCHKQFGGFIHPTFDHEAGRGMSGAWRDDRIVVNGKWQNAALCIECQGTKGSRQYEWRDGEYVPREGKRKR